MINWLMRKLTKNYESIPLFWEDFNLQKYQKDGAKNSCTLHIHPELKNDEHIIGTLSNLVDYIRENYDMEKLSK